MKAISIVFGLLILPVMIYNEKSIDINGTVIDAVERTPLKDCHVYVEGTHIGVVSGDHGEFSLQVPLIYKNRPLIVSYVGYSTFEEKVSRVNQPKIQIAMQPAIVALDEIVIMPGKELIVDRAIEKVLDEYDDSEEMLTDFYLALLSMDQDHNVLKKVMEFHPIEE